MKRGEAIFRIEREQDLGHFEPKLDDAISLALFALKAPNEMHCSRCVSFIRRESDADGRGYCKARKAETLCSDGPCDDYE